MKIIKLTFFAAFILVFFSGCTNSSTPALYKKLAFIADNLVLSKCTIQTKTSYDTRTGNKNELIIAFEKHTEIH